MTYTYTYEIVAPSPIEHTEVKKRYRDGVHTNYYITPNEGYVMHDNAMDYENPETGDFVLGFRASMASVGANYDFEVNDRGFYCVLENEMPEGAELFGGGNNNDHEVM